MSRIIAGSVGGRRINTPTGQSTRPTTDRVREALFSAIASWAGTAAEAAETSLKGLAFLDLFAGSGAVGLEAGSRGAAPIWLVESDRRTAEVIKGNAADLGLEVQLRTGRAEQFLRMPAATAFDVIFLDPPYELENSVVSSMLTDIAASGWLANDGLVIVERSARSEQPTWPDAFADTWVRKYGETALHFCQQ